MPPTAREAAASPEWAAKLAHPSTQPAAKAKVLADRRRSRTSPLDDVIYDNGPVNGTVDAWTINFGYVVGNSFSLLGSNNTVTGFDFYVWAYPGDTPLTVDWSITSEPLGGGTVYGAGTASMASTFLSGNQYGYDVEKLSVTGLNAELGAGTYFLNLQNASTSQGNPLYWDENSGPSQAYNSEVGTIASEAFDVVGSSSGGGTLACLTKSGESTQSQPAGDFNVIYSFTGGQDGYAPSSATVDRVGNVYGTTNSYCPDGCTPAKGFKVSNAGSGWVLNPIYNFAGYGSLRTMGPGGRAVRMGWPGKRRWRVQRERLRHEPEATADFAALRLRPLEGNFAVSVRNQYHTVYRLGRSRL